MIGTQKYERRQTWKYVPVVYYLVLSFFKKYPRNNNIIKRIIREPHGNYKIVNIFTKSVEVRIYYEIKRFLAFNSSDANELEIPSYLDLDETFYSIRLWKEIRLPIFIYI